MTLQRIIPAALAASTVLWGAVAPADASTHHRQAIRCTVPNLTGASLTTARRKLHAEHCSLGVIHRPNTATVDLTVSAQRPRAGRHLKRGSKVRIWLEAKPVNVKVGTTQPTPITSTVPATPTPAAPTTVATTPTPPTPPTPVQPTISYSTSVDPTFTQAANDPLAVTYSVSASASETVGSTVTNLATTGQLPAGVLNFYSQGQLQCSQNVGGATNGGPCTVTYPTTGTYNVTTEYLPTGATPVTQTDTETINPFASTASITIGTVAPFDYAYTWGSFNQFHETEIGDYVPLTFTTTDPTSTTYVATLTDETTGTTYVAPQTEIGPCQLQIDTSDTVNGYPNMPAGDIKLGGSIGSSCGLSATVSATDVLDLSITTAGSNGYLASPASAAEQIWPQP